MKDGTEPCGDIAAITIDLCQSPKAETREEKDEDEVVMVVVEDKENDDGDAAGTQDVDHSVLDRYKV